MTDPRIMAQTASDNSEYRFCSCRDCMDIAIGSDGTLCWACEEAYCEPHHDECGWCGSEMACQREDAYL